MGRRPPCDRSGYKVSELKMNSSNQDDFDRLRKLLALKRHEQPPPGYFNRLPNQIMARIEAGEGEEKFWQRFIPSFTFRPAVAYGMGLAVCGVVALGVYYTSNLPVNNTATANVNSMTASQPPALSPAPMVQPAAALASQNTSSVNSTNPVTEPSLFPSAERIGSDLRTAPAGFTPKQ
jgi:hypothetical protein